MADLLLLFFNLGINLSHIMYFVEHCSVFSNILNRVTDAEF